MYLAELLEVAAGLILVFIILSLAAMQIQETLAGLLRWRADQLEKALRQMLTDPASRPPWLARFLTAAWRRLTRNPAQPAAPTLVDRLYEHPLLRSLAQPGERPSYIPADKFALALFDTVMTAGTEASTLHEILRTLQNDRALLQDKGVKALLQTEEMQGAVYLLLEELDRAAADPALRREVEKKIDDLVAAYPGLQRVFDMASGLQGLILQAAQTGDDRVRLSTLQAAINAFTAQYQELRPVYNALLQARLPVDDAAILRRLRQGASVLLVENPELKQSLDSLMAHAETYARRIVDDQLLAQLRQTAQALAEARAELKEGLDDLLARAETYVREGESLLAQTRLNVERWFDDTMERSTGWYKRNAQWVSFTIGVVLAMLFNIDPLFISQQLWRQPALRHAVYAQAEKFELPAAAAGDGDSVARLKEAFDDLQSSLDNLQIPIGWRFAAVPFDRATQKCVLSPRDPASQVRGLLFFGQCTLWTNPPLGGRAWLTKLLGVLIAGLAAMQGAPFWFDLLKKLVTIRSSGERPAETSPSKS